MTLKLNRGAPQAAPRYNSLQGEALVDDKMRTTVVFYGLMAVAAIAMGLAIFYTS